METNIENNTKKPKVISLTALKGGTGKTVLTFNVASLLAKKYKKKVLVIDIDPQHNISNLLDGKREIVVTSNADPMQNSREYGVEDVLENELEAYQVIRKTQIKNLDIIPTTLGLTVTEVKISGLAGRESILRNWMYDNQKYLEKYDYIFFDSNPTMSIVNINAFLACDSIILVSDIDKHSIGAISTFMFLLFPIRDRVDRRLQDNIKGLVINKLMDNTNMTKDFLTYVDAAKFPYKNLLLDSKLHYATAISETKSRKLPIEPSRNDRSYDEFISLIDEMIQKEVL